MTPRRPSAKKAPARSEPRAADARLPAWSALFAACAWLGLRMWHFSRWTDDDAFISFRYARNLVHGHGLVFNAGERVMGYTNFLWTMLVAAAMRLGADPVSFTHALGILSSFAVVGLLATFGRRVVPGSVAPGPVGFSAALILCVLEPWAIWSDGGLENVFAGLLLLGAFLLHFEHLEHRGRGRLMGAGALGAAAALCHPSNALGGLVLGGHLAWRCARREEPPSALASFLGPIVGLGLPFLIGIRLYYGSFAPNTYYAKVGWTLDTAIRGLGYLGAAGLAFPVIVVAALAVLLAPALRNGADARPRLLLAGVAAFAAYTVVIGGEEFYAFRLIVTLLPLGVLLAQYVLAWVLRRIRADARPERAWMLVLSVAIASALAAGWAPRVRAIDFDIRRDFSRLCRAGALELRRRFPPGILFAHSGAGAMAYYTEFRFLDTLGLNDSTIAHRRMPRMGRGGAGHEKGDGRYVLSRQPDVVMFSGLPLSSAVPLGLPGDFELFALPGFRSGYALETIRFRFQPRGGEPYEVDMPVYVRRPRQGG